MSSTPAPIFKKVKKVNYLNNKDLLKEIHLSKNSYCSYLLPEHNLYDLIIDLSGGSLKDSLEFASQPAQILKAKEVRAARISAETGEPVTASDVADTDIIFRIMSWDHIPVEQKLPKKSESTKKSAKDIIVFDEDASDFSDLEDRKSRSEVDDMVHVKVNFPPFQHFKIDENGSFQCVGKSHWINGLENGHFSKDHGNITNKLAKMYLMLCEKFSMKYNWRGYTYRDEMQASAVLQLTYAGLRFNEAKSENPFAYFSQISNNAFCRILNIEKKSQNIRDDILEANGMTPSMSRQLKDATYTGKY